MAGLLDKANTGLKNIGKKAIRGAEKIADQAERAAEKLVNQAGDRVKELTNEFSGGGKRAEDCFKDLVEHYGKMCDQVIGIEVTEPKHGIERAGLIFESRWRMFNYCESELAKQDIVPCNKLEPVTQSNPQDAKLSEATDSDPSAQQAYHVSPDGLVRPIDDL